MRAPGDALLLLARQQGWGIADEAPDAATTGLVAEVLRPMRFLPEFPAALDGAVVAYALATQKSSGEIGDGQAPVIDTAQGLLALQGLDPARFTQDLALAAARAVAYLQGAQRNDGSWEGSVRVTALVLRALLKRWNFTTLSKR